MSQGVLILRASLETFLLQLTDFNYFLAALKNHFGNNSDEHICVEELAFFNCC